MEWRYFRTRLGRIAVVCSAEGVREVYLRINNLQQYEKQLARKYHSLCYRENLASSLVRKLARYFDGRYVDFRKEKLSLSWASEFEEKVYQAVQNIPYGQTRSYKEIAYRIGKPFASRAVGGALARNQIPILIPCHRVIYQTREIGHYGWGKSIKKFLLENEKVFI